jgi:hypothetical protein
MGKEYGQIRCRSVGLLNMTNNRARRFWCSNPMIDAKAGVRANKAREIGPDLFRARRVGWD